MEVNFIEGKLYDSAGNEVEVPADHVLVVGKDSCCLIQHSQPDVPNRFVFRLESVSQEKAKDFSNDGWVVDLRDAEEAPGLD